MGLKGKEGVRGLGRREVCCLPGFNHFLGTRGCSMEHISHVHGSWGVHIENV